MAKNFITEKIEWLEDYISRIAIINNFAKKHPELSRFVADRFSPNSFKGLTLSILIVLLICATAILSEIAEGIVDSEPIVNIDQAFSQFLFTYRSVTLSRFLFVVTQAGSFYACIIVPALFSVIMWISRRRAYAITMLIVVIGVGLSVYFGKVVFHRARPLDIGYYIEANYSFPSGHSSSSMAMYGFMVFCFMREQFRNSAKAIIFCFGLALILIIGFSRIYLGVHYLSDVLGGFLLGIIWVIFGISLVEWAGYRRLVKNNKPPVE